MKTKREEQINIKFTESEFEIIKALKQKYAINISQFVKNCLRNKFEELEKPK
jgi:hypothetical protein